MGAAGRGVPAKGTHLLDFSSNDEQEYLAEFSRLPDVLKGIQDPDLAILRAHLLAEENLHRYLEHRLPFEGNCKARA